MLGLSLSLCFSLAISSKVALADSPNITLNPAQQVYNSLVSGLLTTGQRNNAIMRDLCWRWFMHTDKRSKVPVIVLSGGKPLTWYVEQYPDSTNRQYQEWLADYQSNLFYKPYDLKSFNGSTTWTSGDAAASIYFAEWYEWFEGTPSSGGDNETTSGNYTYFKVPRTSINISGTEYVYIRVTDTQYQSYLSNLNGGKFYKFVDNNNVPRLFVGPSDKLSYNSSTAVVTIAQENAYVYYWAYGASSGTYEGMPLYDMNNARSDYASWDITFTCKYFSGEAGMSGGGGSNEPVPSPRPTPNPQPQQPNVTNISAPTYTTNNYTTINQTDVNLQPLIDAIKVHDENMQDAWDSYSILFNDWMNVLKETLEGWRDTWLEYTSTLYDDLTMYLYNIEQALENIFWSLNSQPDVKPTIDVGNTLQDQTEVNLDLLTKKFPTSIPWDLLGILHLFEAYPEAPDFTLPVVMTNYTVDIDLSDFDDMAAISRRMSVILFAVGLLMNTKKLISIEIAAGG